MRHRHRPVLAHVGTAEKSNGIPAVQALLAELGVAPRRHRHARCAALPDKHFGVAKDAAITSIVQVKDNQPGLHQEVAQITAASASPGSVHSRDRGRNRDETCTVTVFDPAGKLANTEWRPHVAAIIHVERNVFTRSTHTGMLRQSTEAAFYVCNATLDVGRAAEAIRAHWGIEITSHHSRDATFGEDRSRIRTNPGVFARLRSFAFNILKANRTGTLNHDRSRAALAGVSHLGKLVTIIQR